MDISEERSRVSLLNFKSVGAARITFLGKCICIYTQYYSHRREEEDIEFVDKAMNKFGQHLI